MPDYYDYDYQWYRDYARAVKGLNLLQLRDFWRDEVGSTSDDWDYLLNRIGLARLAKLRADPRYHYNPALARFA